MVGVGQRLHNERIHRKLTLDEVATATKIKSRFLAAIEKGDYNKLPSPAYAQGFVRNYAAFLGLPKNEITALFKREFDEKRAFKLLPESFTRTKEFPLRRIKIQQSIFVIFGIILILGIYLFYQYRSAFIPPAVTVSSPAENAVVSQVITVSGTVDSDASVTVNNIPVTLATDGSFTKKIALFPGKETIIIRAKNRFGKETVVERDIEVK